MEPQTPEEIFEQKIGISLAKYKDELYGRFSKDITESVITDAIAKAVYANKKTCNVKELDADVCSQELCERLHEHTRALIPSPKYTVSTTSVQSNPRKWRIVVNWQ